MALGASITGSSDPFGGLLEPLGASWGVLEPLLSMLAFRLVFKGTLGSIWVEFLHGFETFGAILGKAWERFSNALGDSGLLSAVLGDWVVFFRVLAKLLPVLPAACCS